jgi:hypothetical protein
MNMLKMALVAALISSLSLSAFSLQASASPYHRNVLPDGTVTGPLPSDNPNG